MQKDDIVYLAILIFSIAFGKSYRLIKNKYIRKNVGTLVGCMICFAVSGEHTLHLLFTFFANAVIIMFASPRQCHVLSFTFSFTYIFFFRTTEFFGLPYPPGHTNLIEMILILKIVGLAFEINTSYTNQHIEQSEMDKKSPEEKLEIEYNTIHPGFLDMFHYCFNYIGVLTGPYFKYKTFQDSFDRPFARNNDTIYHTFLKLRYIPLFAILYVVGGYYWPISYARSDEFFTERSWLYRYWYIWPNFFIFRMRMYTGILLSECVFTMAGMGVYPEFTNPKPGKGPSENFSKLKQVSEDPTLLRSEKMNFETIKNIDPYQTEFCTTYREGMKHWNICIQYWLAVNVYKRFPNKKIRTNMTMLVSAVWHGVYLGYYVCIGTVPFVLLLEDVWIKILLDKNKGWRLRISEWVIWFFRMHFFSYQSIAFHLMYVKNIVHYYNSIYHVGLVLGIILYFIGQFLLKRKRLSQNSSMDSINFSNKSK